MYLMYVDESGDCGLENSPSRFFCLSGVVVHELRWSDTIEQILVFRRWLKAQYNVYLDEEIHTAAMISGRPSSLSPVFRSMKKHERLAIIRKFATVISQLRDINIINVVADKEVKHFASGEEVFRRAWYALFQRFENTIRYQNFPGPKNSDDKGIVFADNTDGEKLRSFLDAMRCRNRLKVTYQDGGFYYKDEPIRAIIEQPILRDSRDSYLVQVADCAAFLLKQKIQPCLYMKKHGGNAYFKRFDSILCRFATQKDPGQEGIVRL